MFPCHRSDLKPDNIAQVWRTSGLMRGGTAEPVSRNQILRREWGRGKYYFPCLADHEQDWQPCLDDTYSVLSEF